MGLPFVDDLSKLIHGSAATTYNAAQRPSAAISFLPYPDLGSVDARTRRRILRRIEKVNAKLAKAQLWDKYAEICAYLGIAGALHLSYRGLESSVPGISVVVPASLTGLAYVYRDNPAASATIVAAIMAGLIGSAIAGTKPEGWDWGGIWGGLVSGVGSVAGAVGGLVGIPSPTPVISP